MTLKNESSEMATNENLVELPEDAVKAAMQAILLADNAMFDADDEFPPTLTDMGAEELARAALLAAAPYLMSIGYELGRDAEYQRSVMKRQIDPNPYEAMTK